VAGTCYISKNRYLSIDPTTNYPGAVALRVELTNSADYPAALGRSWWVGEPRCLDAVTGDQVDPAPNLYCRGASLFGWVSELVAAPVTRVWREKPVHVSGCGIVPACGYEVRSSADGGAHVSPPLAIATARDPDGDAQSWGDVTGGPVPGMAGLWLAPEGATNFGDVGNAIRAFEGRTEDTGAPPRPWVDVESNNVINLSDVQFIISAFEGTAYADIADLPFIGVHPVDCP
jgi:hypothetical protein